MKKLIKAIDNYFFDLDSDVFDRLAFYGFIAFMMFVSAMSIIIASR